jgi:hypothetical protein
MFKLGAFVRHELAEFFVSLVVDAFGFDAGRSEEFKGGGIIGGSAVDLVELGDSDV